MVAVATCVEDEYGDVEKIAIYNEREAINPDDLLPVGTIMAVKEPFYKTAVNGDYTIRVDHLSDVVYLDPADERVPLAWQTSSSQKVLASEYKHAGNESYKKGQYFEAAEHYSKGIAASKADSLLSCDLLRNRAIAHLYLKRFESARSDALSSVINSDEADVETKARLNNKALFRAGRAMYELGDFGAAKHTFQNALDLVPTDEDALAEIARCNLRLAEKLNGSYDFAAISHALSSSYASSLDHASFLGSTVVRETSYAAQGLFATKAIKASELILCERTFHVARPQDSLYLMININTNHGTHGPHASLLFAIIDKLRNNPVAWAESFLALYEGGHEPKCAATQVDGAAVIDTFQIQAIIEKNCFPTPALRSSDEATMDGGTKGDDDSDVMSPVGIWPHASRINHACDANATREFLGGLMLIHATRDIAPGDEMTHKYCPPEADVDKQRELLSKSWHFTCNCALCSAEASGTIAQRGQLRALLTKLGTILSKHKLSQERQVANEVIVKVEKLHRDLTSAYGCFMPASMPRLGLIDLDLWLYQAYSINGRREAAYQKAIDALKRAGFRVVLERQTSSITATHDDQLGVRDIKVERSPSCCFDARAIDAAA
jgi:tetratricopeptide (TPR) repeat protein